MNGDLDIPETDGEYGVQSPDDDKDNDGVPDIAEEEMDKVPEESKEYYERKREKSFWKDKPFGRTLTLRNKTGKTIAGTGVAIGSMFLPGPVGEIVSTVFNGLITIQTGASMDFVTDMSFLQMAIAALVVIIPMLLKWKFPALKEKAAWSIINERLDNVADKLIEVVDEDSEEGKKITRNELKELVQEALRKGDN